MIQLRIKRGDDLAFVLRWPEGTDLSGCRMRFDVRNKRTGVKVLSANTDMPEMNISGREVSVRVNGLETRSVAPGGYVWDVETTWADGRIESTETMVLVVEEDWTYDDPS